MYYTSQRTIVCGFPLSKRRTEASLKSIGYKMDYIKDGIFYTKPYRGFWGGWTQFASTEEALNDFSERWDAHKGAYERDGWTAYQKDTESADIIFVSPEGVLNIYTDWKLLYHS